MPGKKCQATEVALKAEKNKGGQRKMRCLTF